MRSLSDAPYSMVPNGDTESARVYSAKWELRLKFLFNMLNHSEIGQRSLEDVIGIFGHQLRALGHQAQWEEDNKNFYAGDDVINVIVEGFVPGHEALFLEAKRQGARFLVLATEEPTEKGFNHGTQPEMTKRQFDFHSVAKHCDGIVHLVPGDYVTKWYGQFAPTAYVELGYAPTLMRSQLFKNPPDYEFGFYGSVTKRRERILRRLANATKKVKAVKIMGTFKTQEERDRDMARAKVIIQLRKFEAMGLVSSSRCNTALSIGRPVVAEKHDLSKPWDEVVKFSEECDPHTGMPTEKFYNTALFMAATWKNQYTVQLEAFKKKLSPEYCVGRALEQIGMTDRQWAEKRQREKAA